MLPALAAIAAIVVCIAAGNWQRERLHAKEALRAQLDRAAHVDPVALATLADDTDWAALRYLPVIATGEFVAARQILIDNKVHAGRAGYEVVTPLLLADSRVVLVDRGWIAQRASRSEVPAIPAPAGLVSVRGRISLPSSRYLELQREPPEGTVWQNLDPARFAAATGLRVLPIVVESTIAPVPDDGLVRDRPPPDLGVDTHRIYMVQWYTFAALAAILWVWFNRPGPVSRGDG
jgi:surfeit locus 1 family protein